MALPLGTTTARLFWLCCIASASWGCATERRPEPGAAGTTSAAPVPSQPAPEEPNVGDFEPEDDQGFYGLYDPYKIRLKQLLFGKDEQRSCQLFTSRSSEPELAVYIKLPDWGTGVVVSRRLGASLWRLTQARIDQEKARRHSDSDIGPDGLVALLDKLRPKIETRLAELDRETAYVASRACEAVLQRTRARENSAGVVDRFAAHPSGGVTYHAGQWTKGGLLTGTVWSPPSGTLTNDYVEFAESLRRYATSEPGQWGALRAELLARAERLRARARRNR